MDGGSFLSLMFTIELLLLLLLLLLSLSSRAAPKTKSEESEEEEKREEEEEEEEHGAQNNNAPSSMMFASLLPLPLPRVLLLAALSIARRNICVFSLFLFSRVCFLLWFFQNTRGKAKQKLSLGFFYKTLNFFDLPFPPSDKLSSSRFKRNNALR